MARLSGKSGSASIGGAISNVSNWEIDYQGDAIDVTGMDSSGAREFIGGLTQWSGTVECHLDSAQALPTPSGAAVAVSLVDSADTGYNTYSGNVIVTGIRPRTAVDGNVQCTITFQGTGALSIA